QPRPADRRAVQRGHPGTRGGRLRRARGPRVRLPAARHRRRRRDRPGHRARAVRPGEDRGHDRGAPRGARRGRGSARMTTESTARTEAAELRVADRTVELPIVRGTEGDDAIDIGTLRSSTGLITY